MAAPLSLFRRLPPRRPFGSDATPGLRPPPRPTRTKVLAPGISAGKTPAVQKSLLFRRSAASERGVAMRKASEPSDDIGVNFRPFQIFCTAGRFVEGNATLLIGKILRMLKGKIEKVLQLLRHLTVEPAHDGSGRNGACERIGGKRPRVTTEHIAWELVQQNQQRE